jgi:hypothetical protein
MSNSGIETFRQELVVANEFDAVTPSVICSIEADACNVSLPVGHGYGATTLVRYERAIGESWRLLSGSMGTSYSRPFLWLRPQQAGPPAWETLFNDVMAGEIMADGTIIRGPLFANADPVGPASALIRSDGRSCAYFRGNNNRIQESCLESTGPGSEAWLGWELGNQTQNATMSPIAVSNPACNPDHSSLFYGCGTGTQVCELRVPNTTYTTTFGSGGFYPGTRPTAIQVSGDDAWQFAVTLNGTTRKVVARRNQAGCSAPSYEAMLTLSTKNDSSNFRFSTPMPYVRVDGVLSLLYFRTPSNPAASTTRIMEQTLLSSGDWTSPIQIHNTNVTIPSGGGAPVPYVDASSGKNTILYRKPYSSGVRDTVMVEQQASGAWTSTLLPSAG